MHDWVGWDAPEELLGRLVHLNVVADPLQPEGGAKGEQVGEDQEDKEADPERGFVWAADPQFLDTFCLVFERKAFFETEAKGDIPGAFLLPFLLAPEEEGMPVDSLLNPQEGVGERYRKDQDLHDEGCYGRDEEGV